MDFAPSAPDTGDPLRWRSLGIAKLSLADVDVDGRADLLAWGYDTWQEIDEGGVRTLSLLRRLEVFRQTAAAATEFVRYGPTGGLPLADRPSSVTSPKGARVADLNRDGLSDLVYLQLRRGSDHSNYLFRTILTTCFRSFYMPVLPVIFP